MGDLVLDGSKQEIGMAKRPLTRVWQHRWWGLGITFGMTALLGVLVALTMPRGPAARSFSPSSFSLWLFSSLSPPVPRPFLTQTANPYPAASPN